ncbi:Hypothetical protein, putative [Bodo saltans]|uniref:Uncharacterized protein n=1 Tax=Bodo saltans TaxID=75058 RepID=A0A0S4JLT8_BODSA|nr:Hypothetical protein, putative [Bodo saltans]|eukprot:CUG92497.1 Hypothetical protein, putative [Bodo saltans]
MLLVPWTTSKKVRVELTSREHYLQPPYACFLCVNSSNCKFDVVQPLAGMTLVVSLCTVRQKK